MLGDDVVVGVERGGFGEEAVGFGGVAEEAGLGGLLDECGDVVLFGDGEGEGVLGFAGVEGEGAGEAVLGCGGVVGGEVAGAGEVGVVGFAGVFGGDDGGGGLRCGGFPVRGAMRKCEAAKTAATVARRKRGVRRLWRVVSMVCGLDAGWMRKARRRAKPSECWMRRPARWGGRSAVGGAGLF